MKKLILLALLIANMVCAAPKGAELLANFPKQWTRLENHNGQRVIYRYCDADTPTVEITKRDGKDIMIFNYGQDADEVEILSVDRTEKGLKFKFKSLLYQNSKVASLEFTYVGTDKKVGRWQGSLETFWKDGPEFVAQPYKNEFKIVKEEDCG